VCAAFDRFICCRDLKAANVLLSSSDIEVAVAKVADFGCSKVMNTLRSTHTRRTGTLAFSSPETFTGKYSEASDVYASAMLAYEVVTRQAPWQELTEQEIIQFVTQRFDEEDPRVKRQQEKYGESIEDQKQEWMEDHPLSSRRPDLRLAEDGCPDALQDLIKKCWADNPGDRPNFAECCDTLEAMESHQVPMWPFTD
jgi:serine/threonine protein kinase